MDGYDKSQLFFRLPDISDCLIKGEAEAGVKNGGPNGSRTRVLALRGPRPGPLDDGTVVCGICFNWGKFNLPVPYSDVNG